MKLSKYDKAMIVKSILLDIPKPDHDKLVERMQAALVKAMSPKVRAVYKVSPKALKTASVWPHEYPIKWREDLFAGDVDTDKALAPFRQQQGELNAVSEKLKTAMDGITTRKQFIDTFPEFSAYAPTEMGTCKTLPAVANVVADLIKVGWEQKVSKG